LSILLQKCFATYKITISAHKQQGLNGVLGAETSISNKKQNPALDTSKVGFN